MVTMWKKIVLVLKTSSIWRYNFTPYICYNFHSTKKEAFLLEHLLAFDVHRFEWWIENNTGIKLLLLKGSLKLRSHFFHQLVFPHPFLFLFLCPNITKNSHLLTFREFGVNYLDHWRSLNIFRSFIILILTPFFLFFFSTSFHLYLHSVSSSMFFIHVFSVSIFSLLFTCPTLHFF